MIKKDKKKRNKNKINNQINSKKLSKINKWKLKMRIQMKKNY